MYVFGYWWYSPNTYSIKYELFCIYESSNLIRKGQVVLEAYISEYRRLTKAGLLCISHKVLVFTTLFMFLCGKYIGIELEILILFLTPIGYMLDLDSNRYVMQYSLPINIKIRLQLVYYFSVVTNLCSCIMVNLSYYISGNKRDIMLSLLVFMIEMIGCSLYYFLFSSQELKKDILDEDKLQLIYQAIVGGLMGIEIIFRFNLGATSIIEQGFVQLEQKEKYALIIGLGVFTVWWTKHSMKCFEKEIRHGK